MTIINTQDISVFLKVHFIVIMSMQSFILDSLTFRSNEEKPPPRLSRKL